MALIKIPKEMGSTPGIVDNSNATAITIDSSENLTLSGSTVVLNNAGGDAQMYFGGTSGTNRMYLARSGSDSLLWNVSNGLMKFGVNNQEALRLTAARDMYFGSFSGDAAHVGHIMQANGALYNTRDQGTVQYLRRLTTDGAIVEFNKDTSLVGSIGTAGGDLTVNAASLGVLQVGGASKYGWNGSFIYPTSDNARDLGTSSFRFKDIFLSGGVNFSANANAGGMTSETLDDYEYGTWTPAIAGCTISIGRANYIKIGGLVKLDFNLVITGNDSSGAAMTITGVPFTATTANSESTNNPMIRYFDFDSGTIDVLMYHYSRTSTIEFYEISDDSNWSIIRRDQITSSSAAIIGTLIITVD